MFISVFGTTRAEAMKNLSGRRRGGSPGNDLTLVKILRYGAMPDKKTAPISLLLLLLGVLVAQTYGADMRIEAPLGGWFDSSGEPIDYTQDVLSPASSVSAREGQSVKGLIKGHIQRSLKKRELYTLIVNGVAMPLPVD